MKNITRKIKPNGHNFTVSFTSDYKGLLLIAMPQLRDQQVAIDCAEFYVAIGRLSSAGFEIEGGLLSPIFLKAKVLNEGPLETVKKACAILSDWEVFVSDAVAEAMGI